MEQEPTPPPVPPIDPASPPPVPVSPAGDGGAGEHPTPEPLTREELDRRLEEYDKQAGERYLSRDDARGLATQAQIHRLDAPRAYARAMATSPAGNPVEKVAPPVIAPPSPPQSPETPPPAAQNTKRRRYQL